jgi:uncharacterized DUF497 family protein
MEFSGFDWDSANRAKCAKHGVPVSTVESLFLRGLLILPDEAHSLREQRFKAVGRTEQGRAVFVVFTLRRSGGATLIRPISARYMHRKEVEHYEKSHEI